MICIIAGNYLEAQRYAKSQYWTENEWFYPIDENDLMRYKDFHVIVVGTAGQNVPSSYFEKVYQLARERGRMK